MIGVHARYGFCIAFIFLFSAKTLAQEHQDDNVRILALVYDMNFEEADSILNATPADQYQKSLLEIQLLRWKHVPIAFSTESDAYLKKLLDTEASFEKSEPTSKDLYFRIGNYFLLSEFYLTKGDQGPALSAMQKAYPLVISCFEDSLRLPENEFIKGTYLYYTDLYGDKNAILNIFLSALKKGDRETGLKLLSQVAFSDSMAGIEAAIYYGQILMHHEKDLTQALSIYERLCRKFPGNFKFRELYVECLIATRQFERAEILVSGLLKIENEFYQCAAQLFQGILEEDFLNNPVKAKSCYTKSIASGKGYGSMLQRYSKEAQARLEKL